MNQKYNLKIGIIGCGRMARVHLGYILQNISRENIAVCDLDEIRAEAFAEEFQITKCFNDIDKMLNEFKPDICHVITPPHAHAKVAIQCMNHGSHVFIEKPMCTTLEDADKIISVSNKMKKLVCIGHQRLFEKSIIEAKRLVESGKLGSVVHVSVVDNNNFLKMAKSAFVPGWNRNLPGGKFFDFLPHLIYMVDYFAPGLKFKNSYYTLHNGEISGLYADFTSANVVGSLHISLSCDFLQNYIRIECTNGVIYIDLRNYVTFVTKKKKLPDVIERVSSNLNTSYQLMRGTLKTILLFGLGRLKPYEGTGKLINKFYDAVLQGSVSPVPPESGKKVVSLSREVVSTALGQTDRGAISIKEDTDLKHKVFIKEPSAKILVTGGTGFIGRHLVERLVNNKQKVRVLSRGVTSSITSFSDNVEVIKGSVSDKQAVDAAMKGIDIVYHLAAAMSGDWTQHLDTTVRGTKNVLDAMVKNDVKKLVYVSSVSVYDHTNYPNNGIIDEEFPYEKNPYKRGCYTNAKLKAEKLVRKYMEDGKINACIIRPGMVYGPGRRPLSVLPPHIALKKIFIILGKPKKKLHLVHVKNLVDALILAGENEKANGCIFNIVDHNDATLKEYMNSYKHLAKNSFFTIYIPPGILQLGFKIIESTIHLLFKKEPSFCYKLKSISKNVTYSTEKIEKMLGWRSKVSFGEGFRETLDLYGKA